MSVRHQRATGAIFEQILIMVIALMVPLLISFVIYLIGSASAPNSSGVPSVGYGIQCLSARTPPAGVCDIIETGTTTNPVYISFPSIVVNALNALMAVVAVVVALIEGIRLAPRLMESRED